jgi:site-specific recombinase XerD
VNAITVRSAATCWVMARRKRGEISEISARDYLPRLDHFARSVGEDRKAARITRRHVEAWREQLAKLAPASQRAYWTTVRQWLRWLCDEGILPSHPMKDMPAPREPRSIPRALRREQVRSILECCDDRTRLIVVLMVQCGLRRGEVARARIEDIDRAERVMLVHGKGGDERIVYVPAQALACIERYIAALEGVGSGSGPLVRSHTQPWTGVTPETVGRAMSRVMMLAGVKQRPRDGVSGHCCRHTAATDMLRGGAHPRDVQQALGHAALATTERYFPLLVESLESAMSGRTY